MKLERQKIIIDIDDTLLKSSEEIIRQLNKKNRTEKTIEDLKDYNYRSIDKNITQTDILDMYSSDVFFNNVKFNDYVIEFLKKFIKIFDIVFVSYGDHKNIAKKIKFINTMIKHYKLHNISFVGCDINNLNKQKSDVILQNAYLVVDNHIEHLMEYQAPKKILLKNYCDVKWNKAPINYENIYIVDNFKEIEEMIDFDLRLKREGIIIG